MFISAALYFDYYAAVDDEEDEKGEEFPPCRF